MPKISNEEFIKISRDMEVYHGVFSQLWKMGKPVLDEKIDTACVRFNKEGNCVDFCFSPKFWKESSDTLKHFTICHESLHVMFGHGKRGKGLIPEIANVAMDIVINECLVSQFGFDRDEIAPIDKDGKRPFCWLDNVFPKGDVERGRRFEYYYELLAKNVEILKMAGAGGLPSTVDSHEGLGGIPEESEKEMQEEISKNLSEEELDSLSKKFDETETSSKEGDSNSKEGDSKQETPSLGRGTIAGNLKKFILNLKVKKKRKWEVIIKKWSSKYVTHSNKEIEQWAMVNRRLNMLPKEIFIPSDFEVEEMEKENKRIQVWFFQDVSGSCSHLVERFYKAAKSLPEKRFDIRMHCFDTRVHRVDLKKNEVLGNGWGTSFDIIESYIQSEIAREGIKYPKAVFVITDGLGNRVNPKIPKRWFWFLSINHTSCIPKECNIFKLEDFE